jgi:hypothetical protein
MPESGNDSNCFAYFVCYIIYVIDICYTINIINLNKLT